MLVFYQFCLAVYNKKSFSFVKQGDGILRC